MIIKYIIITVILMSTLFSNSNTQKVSILLKWKHSFQFAGYYAALEKGFYKDAGLDVKLIEGGPEKNSISFVTSSSGRYAVSDSSLIFHYLNKKPVVLVSQIFQHSPLVLLSHKDSEIVSLFQMNNKDIVYGNEIILHKLLKDIEFNKIYHSSKSFQEFIDKKVDVFAGYSISTPFHLKELGVDVNIINPQDYGIDYYGDNLFTSKFEAKNYTNRVEKIKKATLRGWDYALKNQNEIIELIQKKYNRNLSFDALSFESKELNKIILPHLIPLGTINRQRYEDLLQEYKKYDTFKNSSLNDDFYFTKEKKIEEKKTKKVNLLNEEKEWLLNHKSFNFTGDPEWLPMEAFDKDGNYIGIVSDYLEEISKLTGIKFNIIPTGSWSQSIKYSKDRTVDILSDTVESYREDVIFTKPYFKTEIVIVMNKKQNFVNNLEDIKDKKIAIVKDYSYITKITSKYPFLDYLEVNSVEEGLSAISRGEADAFLSTLAKASYSMSELSLSNIKIVGKTEFSTELGFAIRSDYKQLVDILNRAIDNIEKKKKSEIFNRWVKTNYIKEKDYSLALKTAVVFILILSWFIYTNYRMKKEITLRKRLESSLKKSKQEAVLANKSKSEFLANMSHEIRTPMNSVIGFSELLTQTSLDNKQKAYLNSIIKSSKNLLNIINDILDLSKIEAGKMNIEKNFIDLKSILNDIHHLFQVSAEEKDILFEVEVNDKLPNNIYCDEVRIRQILVNLVGNAIKFTHKGYVRVEVLINIVDEEYCNIRVDVKDSGIGIKKEEVEKIFQNFEQQDGQSTRRYGGTGLGLAISKKLAKKLDGDILVNSLENKGSTFSLELINIKYNNKEQYTLTKDEKRDEKQYFFENSLVLVVDDIEDNRELLKEKLKSYNINSIEVSNGKEALDMVVNSGKIFDMILMDIRMPVMDGYEALKNIKANKKFEDIPIIAVTASILKEEQEKIIKRGFTSYLQKPIIHEEFITLVRKYLKCKVIESEDVLRTKIEVTLDENLKKEFLAKFNERLSNQGIVNNFTLLSKLNEEIKEFAKENNKNSLLDLCDTLSESIDSFDIEKIQNIVKKLKKV